MLSDIKSKPLKQMEHYFSQEWVEEAYFLFQIKPTAVVWYRIWFKCYFAGVEEWHTGTRQKTESRIYRECFSFVFIPTCYSLASSCVNLCQLKTKLIFFQLLLETESYWRQDQWAKTGDSESPSEICEDKTESGDYIVCRLGCIMGHLEEWFKFWGEAAVDS